MSAGRKRGRKAELEGKNGREKVQNYPHSDMQKKKKQKTIQTHKKSKHQKLNNDTTLDT
jgi:hypothetical protein